MIHFDKDKKAYGYGIEECICSISEEVWEQYAGTDKWDIIDGVFTDITNTPEYIAKKEEEEKIRISNLRCTKRVLALILQQLGISYTQLKELIATNEQAQLEWDLCVELERSNPLLDIIGAELGLTHADIDNIFLYANGELSEIAREVE